MVVSGQFEDTGTVEKPRISLTATTGAAAATRRGFDVRARAGEVKEGAMVRAKVSSGARALARVTESRRGDKSARFFFETRQSKSVVRIVCSFRRL